MTINRIFRLSHTLGLMVLFYVSYAQNHSLEYRFLSISKTIAGLDYFSDGKFFTEYDGYESFFVLGDPRFISSQDEQLNLVEGDLVVRVWFKKHLFVEDIPYWFELEVIEIEEDPVEVVVKSYNSVNSGNRRPRISGIITLRWSDGQYNLINADLSNDGAYDSGR